jgi:hypothetical protein
LGADAPEHDFSITRIVKGRLEFIRAVCLVETFHNTTACKMPGRQQQQQQQTNV